MEMTSRERVKAAVDFTGPDRLPIRHACLPSTFKKYPETCELLRRFPSDFAGEYGVFSESVYFKAGQWTDEWNCRWTIIKDGFMGQVTGHPLENLDILKDFQWPDAKCIDISGEAETAWNRGDRYVMLGWLTLFERMVDLRGFENLMADLAAGEPGLVEIRDKILKYNFEMIDRLLELEPDGIALADDWGSQISIMISPSVWREVFLPAYRLMFERIHNAGKHIFFHSDGYTIDILPDLCNEGVNIFWVDLTVNGINVLKKKLGGKVCFMGLTDVQFVMRNGTPIDVEKHGRELIRSLGCYDGGFIGCSELAPDQPWENILTIMETFDKYGKYPLVI